MQTGLELPRRNEAHIAPGKLRDYVLDPDHPQGRHKARVFAAGLGIYREDWEYLRNEILLGVLKAPVTAATSYAAERRVLTREQVANVLAVSPRTVARLVERGELPVVHVGRLARFRPADVEALLVPETVEAPVDQPSLNRSRRTNFRDDASQA
jgi:excisionase family DNA binding protein